MGTLYDTKGRAIQVDDDIEELYKNKTIYSKDYDDGYTYFMIELIDLATMKKRRYRLHRMIMNTPGHLVCDHIFFNYFDLRRCSLRNITQQQNTWNRRPNKGKDRKGASYRPSQGKYEVRFRFNDKEVPAGKLYQAKRDAHIRWNELAREHYGEFAWLNPDGDSCLSGVISVSV